LVAAKVAVKVVDWVVRMADGFLGRWSQRKQAAREGLVLEEPALLVQPAAQLPAVQSAPMPKPELAQDVQDAQRKTPAPTLDDVKALNADSSFAPFVARDVAPDVRNAAMKKLFTDPHYNVMDQLDIYIDDYSLSDPVPQAMLRQMSSAKFLNLFDEDPAVPAEVTPLKDENHHDHTDLRLQPDNAAGPASLEHSTEPAPDPAFEPVPPSSA
jgi:hypothetical protein